MTNHRQERFQLGRARPDAHRQDTSSILQVKRNRLHVRIDLGLRPVSADLMSMGRTAFKRFGQATSGVMVARRHHYLALAKARRA